MKTAEETVQEFLFKNKPKKKYCNEFDVKDLVNLLQKFAIEYHEEQVKNLNILGVSSCSDKSKLVKCSNCNEMVEMISTGEFCPRCYC